jgi:tetratricopeptide (TPR) repeat protein
MNQCTDEKIGRLLIQYELGELSDEDRDLLEKHMMECDSCFEKFQAMQPVAESWQKNKPEILARFQKDGISFDSEKQKLRESFQAEIEEDLSVESFWDNLKSYADSLIRPTVLVPAGAVVAVFLLLFIFLTPQPDNPYLSYLNFKKVPYEQMTVRGNIDANAQALYDKGMSDYINDDYKTAAAILREAVTMVPDEGTWWFYLGICHYLDRDPQPAIEALSMADSLTKFTLNARSRWYLAQSYLLAGDSGNARPVLEKLTSDQRHYSEEAAALLIRMKAEDEQEKK